MTHRNWVLVLAAVASFMVALDTLVVSTALTTIRAHLQASVDAGDRRRRGRRSRLAVDLLDQRADRAARDPARAGEDPRIARRRGRPGRARARADQRRRAWGRLGPGARQRLGLGQS